ncbi:MAG: hypothetical protein V4654_12230 [Bdellovibrionota bacterium]
MRLNFNGKATNQVITNKIENKIYATRELYQTEDNFLILSRTQEHDWKSKNGSKSINLNHVEVYTPAQARNIEIVEEVLQHSLIGQKAKIAGKILEIQLVYTNGLIIGFAPDELQGC